MKYKVGQYVYTSKKINGWWDYSVANHIPENTCGIIEGVCNILNLYNEIVYAVRFPKFPELKCVLIRETSLKLG